MSRLPNKLEAVARSSSEFPTMKTVAFWNAQGVTAVLGNAKMSFRI